MKKSYIRFGENLFLAIQEVEKIKKTTETVLVDEPVHYIFICDCSGSMYGSMDRLRRDVKEKIRTLRRNDTLTIARFSSEGGDFNFFMRGFRIIENTDFDGADKLIDKHLVSTNMTCFSEVLGETRNVIDDLKVFGNNFAFVFLTDGNPMVSNYGKEIQAINTALEAIKDDLNSSLVVGYSDYYNREILSNMTETLGGSFVHSDNLGEFSIALTKFIEKQEKAGKRFPVTIQNLSTPDFNLTFSIDGDNINLYRPTNGGVVSFSTDSKLPTDNIYTVVNSRPKDSEQIPLDIAINEEKYLRVIYATACALSQKAKTDRAIDVLGAIGDVYYIDRLYSAFTNSEYGSVENGLKRAIMDKSERFVQGQKKNYVPKKNAFCLFNLIELLSEDKEAKFFPRSKEFAYKLIGRKSITDDKLKVKFEASDEGYPMTDLVWNSARPNLSIRIREQGEVRFLNGEHKKHGLPDSIPSFRWKNFTFVVDAVLNVKMLPVQISEDTFEVLRKETKLIHGNTKFSHGKVYLLDLSKIPIMNKEISECNTSATDFCQLLIDEQIGKARNKVLNYYHKKASPPEDRIDEGYTSKYGAEIAAFLNSNFIFEDKGFSPETKKADPTDYYLAKEFIVKISGLSSLPSVEAVLKKIESGKSPTTSEALLQPHVVEVLDQQKSLSNGEFARWLKSELDASRKSQREISRSIQDTKFSMIMGKRWFQEFDSRENCELDLGGYHFTIELKEVKEYV